MAIVQMQRINICALKKNRKAILERLQELGAMEIDIQLDIDLHGSQFLQTFQDRFPILLQCTDIDPLHLHDCHIHIPPFLFFQSTPMM